MGSSIIPWQTSNIASEIQNELNRRKVNRSFKYVQNSRANWDKDGDWNSYRGPMVSWIRACSNGAGHPEVHETGSGGGPIYRKERFVLYSGKGFYNTYGFGPPEKVGSAKTQIIGYTPGWSSNGAMISPSEPHIIENSLITPGDEPVNYPIYVPPPEISRLEATIQKEWFRRVQIEWVCFSWKQLVYMTPYFLVPGITCMIEWGWNHYDVRSLVELGDVDKMRKYWDNAYPLYIDNIIKSKGNYDVIYGIISNFNWSIEGNKIICTTEITSKDRLYAGVSKDYALSVENKDDTSKNGIFKSIKNFIEGNDTINNYKSIASKLVTSNTLRSTTNPTQKIWYDIINPLLTKGSDAQKAIRMPYIYGYFAGREPDDKKNNTLGSYNVNEKFGTPADSDFDKTIQNNDVQKYFWINMGMVVAILNHFSIAESGAQNGKNLFEVDIQNTVIGGHPNLISCDPKVLIPNYKAPKFLYGDVGDEDSTEGGIVDPNYPYSNQVLNPKSVGDNIPNKFLSEQLLQIPDGVCYRDDIDSIINYNRYRFTDVAAKTANISFINYYSFPSSFTSNGPLPDSMRGLHGNQLEQDYSGLLSNIYISFEAFKEAILDDSNSSYTDIYKHILKTLMDSSDGFWDLQLIDVDNTLTITDKNYVGKFGLDFTVDSNGKIQNGDVVYSFDYYDVDSIIKSLKFRPVLSDLQATRTIFGEVNNKDSKYKYLDKNDVLDYKFKDSVIGTYDDKKQGDAKGDAERSKTALEQKRDLIRNVQHINGGSDDSSLQMTLNPYRRGNTPPVGTPPYGGSNSRPEIVKLVMPENKLLRLLLNDGDYENNGRYCAVQPGIYLELTLQGIGGLRTFQYFLIKNLPEPYSDRNVIFRITDVHHTLESGTWETTIRAQLSPLKGYIKKSVIGPYQNGTPNTTNGWLND